MSFQSTTRSKKRSVAETQDEDERSLATTGGDPRRSSIVHSSFVRIHKGRKTIHKNEEDSQSAYFPPSQPPSYEVDSTAPAAKKQRAIKGVDDEKPVKSPHIESSGAKQVDTSSSGVESGGSFAGVAKKEAPHSSDALVPDMVFSYVKPSASEEDESPVPGPPPLQRVEGQSTMFNTYTSGVHSSEQLAMSLGTVEGGVSLQPTLKTSSVEVAKQRRLEECTAIQNLPTFTHSLRTSPTDKASSEPISDKKPSPVNTSDSTPPSIHQTVSTDDTPQVTAPSQLVTVPASWLTGRMVDTPHGLAVLLLPQAAMEYAALSARGVNPSVAPAHSKNKRWTKAEDKLLAFAVEQEGGPPHNWKEISRTYFPGMRSDNQCKGRWKKKLDPSIERKPFTPEEDKLIIEAQAEGLPWPEVANKLPGRSSDQVRSRFSNHIDPSLKKNVDWTKEEDRILNSSQSLLGNKWTEIATKLPGRSENDCKNRWHNAKTKRSRLMKKISADNDRQNKLARLRGQSVRIKHEEV